LILFCKASSLRYKNNGNVKAIATKNVSGIKSHQYFIFKRNDSEIIKTKNTKTTIDKSAPIDLPAKFCCASLKNAKNEMSSAV
jgi:hypothetical protein